MKLSEESRAEMEAFLRWQLGEDALRLPPVSIYAGWFARLLVTKLLGVGAITFGRHIFVAPSLVRRGEGGRFAMPGRLLAHELAHVLQYESKGWLRFFFDYLRGYFRGLRVGRRWDALGRMNAYLEIAEERAAREVEHAYAEFRKAVWGE
jgi:hypothetical protein